MQDYGSGGFSQKPKFKSTGKVKFRLRWVLIVIIALVVIGLMVHTFLLHRPEHKSGNVHQVKHAQIIKSKLKAKPKPKPKLQKPVFDFYKLLPNHKKAELKKMQANNKLVTSSGVTSGVSSGAKKNLVAPKITVVKHVSTTASRS